MSFNSLPWTDIVAALLVLALLRKVLKKKQALPLPPGPKGWPLIGNLLDIPRENFSETFSKWGERYGGIVYVETAGQPMIILNDATIVNELLDKKSATYSDRPFMEMAYNHAGFSDVVSSQMYSPQLKRMRKFAQKAIGTRSGLDKFSPIFESETHNFLKATLRNPKNVEQSLHHSVGSIIILITYGYKVREKNDPIVHLVETAMQNFSDVSQPGAYLVDLIPALKYLPTWFPGAGFKRIGAKMRPTNVGMAEVPFAFTKGEMEKGTAVPSFVSEILKTENLSPDDEHSLKWVAGSLFGAGADTTVATLCGFFLAMTLHPDAQGKAQEEIDRVVGTDRLPTLADRDNLPYVTAILCEVLRWGPVVPTGLPHRTMVEDTHRGYYIPKNSMVIANIQHILHDPGTYHNPEMFIPERFAPTDGETAEPDPRSYTFGFGRRLCPGKQFADAALWLSIARILAVFRISKSYENGVEVTPEKRFAGGIIAYPEDIRCDIKPRSAQAEALILGN
ncbi:cytochrome P450 [Gloeopeniophorella convolvens]|nr:cytochrome P450 [Gloeopeniophorella convolvens]